MTGKAATERSRARRGAAARAARAAPAARTFAYPIAVLQQTLGNRVIQGQPRPGAHAHRLFLGQRAPSGSRMLLHLQRTIGNRATGQVLTALRSLEHPVVQRMKIEFPQDMKIDPIDTAETNAAERIKVLAGNRPALEVVRDRLSSKTEREEHEQRAYEQALSMLTETKSEGLPLERQGPRVEFGFPNELLVRILSYFESKELVRARLVSKKFGQLVMFEAGRRIPYPDWTIFSLLNHVVFPDEFAKGNFTDAPMTKTENLQYSWKQYQSTHLGKENLALVLRIFETKTFKKLKDKQAQEFENEQVIFRPATPKKWSPQIDDSWILAHIHKKNTMLIISGIAR